MSTASGAGALALLVGGGPAPGINGVIGSVAIEAVEQERKANGLGSEVQMPIFRDTGLHDLENGVIAGVQICGRKQGRENVHPFAQASPGAWGRLIH